MPRAQVRSFGRSGAFHVQAHAGFPRNPANRYRFRRCGAVGEVWCLTCGSSAATLLLFAIEEQDLVRGARREDVDNGNGKQAGREEGRY